MKKAGGIAGVNVANNVRYILTVPKNSPVGALEDIVEAFSSQGIKVEVEYAEKTTKEILSFTAGVMTGNNLKKLEAFLKSRQ